MRIGLDAKRIFNNPTGLGVYGRNLLQGFIKLKTTHSFTLYAPSIKQPLFDPSLLPTNFSIKEKDSYSSYYWRTFSLSKKIEEDKITIYHGLSNELPHFINKTNVKSIVDIHDLCFVRFPQDYSLIDRQIFWTKAKRAALNSHCIIATSEATKKDIVEYFNVPSDKVKVVYQCCDSSFYEQKPKEELEEVRQKHKLPAKFVLSVGTIQGRKNQKSIVKAISLLPKKSRLPLVLVGNGKQYLNELLALASNLEVQVIVKSELPFKEIPAIYQLAALFIYPSFVEGFGIPVLEAMASKTPVISSAKTSMAEILDNEDCLINPNNKDELQKKISHFLSSDLTSQIEKNHQRALEFSQEKFAQNILDIYDEL